MEFQSIDTTTYYMFLALGILLTLSGLTLIFRKSADENAARIELFGLKFQASSAGTLVLLVGVGLLMIPLFVPRIATPSDAAATNTPAPQDLPTTALVLPQTASAEEIEPNDFISDANQFSLGFGAKGKIDKERDDHSDWFVVDTTDTIGKDLRVQIRSPWGGCYVAVFDENEQEIEYAYCENGGSGNVDFFNKDNQRIFLRIVFNNGSAAKRSEYEVFVKSK